MFYELNTWDPFGSSPWKRSDDGPLKGTFDGNQDIFAQITLLLDQDAHLTQGQATAAASLEVTTEAAAGIDVVQAAEVEVPSILPDG